MPKKKEKSVKTAKKKEEKGVPFQVGGPSKGENKNKKNKKPDDNVHNDDDYDYDDYDDNDSESFSELTTDKMGNTISKIEAKQKDAEERMRAEAKARRLAKAATVGAGGEPDQRAVLDDTGDGSAVDTTSAGRPQWLQDYDRVKAKLASGKKLSGKDKKLLKRGEAREAEDKELGITYVDGDEDEVPLDKRLEGFSLSLADSRVDTDAADTNDNERQHDVVIKGITLSAPSKSLLVNADLTLTRGHRYGLIGANGRGKSTLLRFLAARRLPVPSTLDILLVEQEVAASKTRTVLEDVLAADVRRAALLKEEELILTALENKDVDVDVDLSVTVEKLTSVVDELDAIGADGAEARARGILSGLGFTEHMVENPPSQLSGGWRMRVSLARALLAAPKLLLLDEPTNHLDLDAVLWLDSYLTTIFPKNSTVLTVSHDRDFLDETCTDLILLTDDGGLEYHRGGLDRLDRGAASRNAKRVRDFALQQKMLQAERAKHPSLKLDRLMERLTVKLGVPRLAEQPREYKVHFDLVAPDDARTGANLGVDLRDVHFSYDTGGGVATTPKGRRREKSAFRGFSDLNLSVDASVRAAIVGANGSGKSTLLKLLAGGLEPTRGEVTLGRRLEIGYYDQHFSELKQCTRSTSAVDYLLSTYGDSLSSPQDARRWLGKFGLDSARHVMPIGDLSGGQKARVCFASIALRRPHLLLLDEPTNHLDLESVDALIDGLRVYDGGVLAVTHDACLVHALSRDVDTGGETPIYVCRDSTVVLERGGFGKYRKDLAVAAEEREKRATAVAQKRAVKRARERREKLVRLRTRVDAPSSGRNK